MFWGVPTGTTRFLVFCHPALNGLQQFEAPPGTGTVHFDMASTDEARDRFGMPKGIPISRDRQCSIYIYIIQYMYIYIYNVYVCKYYDYIQ